MSSWLRSTSSSKSLLLLRAQRRRVFQVGGSGLSIPSRNLPLNSAQACRRVPGKTLETSLQFFAQPADFTFSQRFTSVQGLESLFLQKAESQSIYEFANESATGYLSIFNWKMSDGCRSSLSHVKISCFSSSYIRVN